MKSYFVEHSPGYLQIVDDDGQPPPRVPCTDDSVVEYDTGVALGWQGDHEVISPWRLRRAIRRALVAERGRQRRLAHPLPVVENHVPASPISWRWVPPGQSIDSIG